MITTPTVFVLGAGASAPYGFPLGGELLEEFYRFPDKISGSNQDQIVLRDRMQSLGLTSDQITDFVSALRESDRRSIDAFLAHRPEFQEVGKTLIAFEIVRRELKQNPFFKANPKEDIYGYLINKLDTGPLSHFGNNKVAFVTFNYDRSLEQYLLQSLCARHGASEAEVVDIINENIPIIHVHGQVGRLPWQDGTLKRPYSNDTEPSNLRVAREGIQIISEVDEKHPMLCLARGQLVEAARIFYLGFGYHAECMERLFAPTPHKQKRFGTTRGFTLEEANHLGLTHDFSSGHPDYDSVECLRRWPQDSLG